MKLAVDGESKKGDLFFGSNDDAIDTYWARRVRDVAVDDTLCFGWVKHQSTTRST